MPDLDLQNLVDEIARDMARETDRGKVATYIPSLASVPVEQFGISILGHDGQCFSAGDADVPFSVQSTSKVFTLTMALDAVGDTLWTRVGREPSGSPFNSIVQLESEKGIPRNPFINSGAIVVADVLLEIYKDRTFLDEFLNFMKHVSSDETIYIDEEELGAWQLYARL
jgi:glutaminase